MNASVTTTARKTAAKKTAAKTVGATRKSPAQKPAVSAKSSAAREVASPKKNTTRSASPVVASGVGAVKKSSPKAASSASAASASSKPAVLAKPARSAPTKAPEAVATRAAGVVYKRPAEPAALMSGNKANGGSPNRIEKTPVSKVREVATKTLKASPVAEGPDGLISEAQLLKMGDKDYMNAQQLAFFKARLRQLEKELLRNAGETTEHLRETVLVPDPADRATIEEEHALELRTRDRERKLLKKVQQSIASIDAGDYGWCEETGEPIGVPRLLARPTATLSLEAQQRRELKQKLYGD
jgi:DnaK suppressor protein